MRLMMLAVLIIIQMAASPAINSCIEVWAPRNYYLADDLSGLYGGADYHVGIFADDVVLEENRNRKIEELKTVTKITT